MAKTTKKTNDTYRIVAVLLAVVFVALFFIAGFGSSWFTNGDISTWFNSWGKAEEPPKQVEGDKIGSGGSLIPGEVKGSGIRLMSAAIPAEKYSEYGIDAQADSGYTVTAIIEPEEATNKAVTYSAAFQNASSAWANGKTVSDYVTLVQNPKGSLTATLTIKQAFGEPVIVTATSDENPDISAHFPVHYVKRITGVTSSVASSTGLGANSIALGADTTYRCTPTLGIGTVAGDFEITAKIKFAESYFWGPLQSNTYYTQAMNYSGLTGTKSPRTEGWNLFSKSNETAGTFRLTDSRDFFALTGGGDLEGFCKRMNTAIYQVAKNRIESESAAYGLVTFTVVNKYVDENGTEHFRETKTTSSEIKAIDMSATSVSVSGLSFPEGTVIYG